MAVLRSDIIVPEVFTPYVIEQTTQRDSFLASGVVAPMAELNATEGGDFVNVPFFSANLSGDFEVLYIRPCSVISKFYQILLH